VKGVAKPHFVGILNLFVVQNTLYSVGVALPKPVEHADGRQGRFSVFDIAKGGFAKLLFVCDVIQQVVHIPSNGFSPVLLGNTNQAVYAHVLSKFGFNRSKLPLIVGTMIEIPRACVTADQLAEECEFFSFGTNDLTQMGFGFSRDDIGGFLPIYLDKKILPDDPFQTIDQRGIGELIQMGITKGRGVNPKLKVGICGEHGGEPESVKFCHRVGMTYVSCSPFRVPIARLAAAQEAGADAERAKALEVPRLSRTTVKQVKSRATPKKKAAKKTTKARKPPRKR